MTHNPTINQKLNDAEYRRQFEQEFLAFAATELIATLMKEQGAKKADLAKKIGKSKAFVSQVLAGTRNMTMHTFADLAFALGSRVDLNAIPLTMPELEAYEIDFTPKTKYLIHTMGQEGGDNDDAAPLFCNDTFIPPACSAA